MKCYHGNKTNLNNQLCYSFDWHIAAQQTCALLPDQLREETKMRFDETISHLCTCHAIDRSAILMVGTGGGGIFGNGEPF